MYCFEDEELITSAISAVASREVISGLEMCYLIQRSKLCCLEWDSNDFDLI